MLVPALALFALVVAASKKRGGDIVREAQDALDDLPSDYTADRVRASGFGGSMHAAQIDPLVIHIGFRRGHCVGIHPATGAKASVRLRDVAKKMGKKRQLAPTVAGDEEFLGYVDLYDDGPGAQLMVSGKVAKKLKAGLKKVAAVAKKVVNNKVVRAIGSMVMKVLPPPISTAVGAVQMGVGVAKKIAGAIKGSPAAKAKPIVSALAQGTITRPQAEARARAIGMNAQGVVAAGVALKLRADANKGDPKARAVFQLHEQIERSGSDPAAARATVAMIQNRGRPSSCAPCKV